MEFLDVTALSWLVACPTADIGTEAYRVSVERANATTILAALEQIPTGHRSKIKMLDRRLTQLEEAADMARKQIPTAEEMQGRTAHADVADASKEIYALAQADAETKLTAMREEIEAIREESFGMGALHAIDANISYNEFLKAMTLYRIKQGKEYRKGGMTWDAFCEARGLARRTVDLMLEDMRPVFESFSAKIADLCGMPFSKIRQLGKTISANLAEIKDGCLIYGDESIPLTPEYRYDIQALIERIGEEAKEKVETLEATVSAKDKVLKSKEDVINKQERALKKYEKDVAAKGLSPEEDSLLGKIDALGVELNGYCLKLETIRDALLENCFPSTIAAFITLADNVRMKIACFRETAVDISPPGMLEESDGGWQPPVAISKKSVCQQCFDAHPGCDECCDTCKKKCNAVQHCRMKSEIRTASGWQSCGNEILHKN